MPIPDADHVSETTGPVLAPLGVGDVISAIGDGIRDFKAAPWVSIAIAAVYTLGGWLLACMLFVLSMPFLVYPVAMGFALVAPFVAVAFYEVSRSRTAGEQPTVYRAWCAVCDAKNRDIRWMALITSFAFFLWMDLAAMITLSFFGAAALDLEELLRQITTTTHGWLFLVVGHAAGAIIALIVFSISVISIPMLFDRDIDIISAIRTSVEVVTANPFPLAVWCMVIASSVVVSVATGLLLLPIVLPVLGYASWHLYRKAVAMPPHRTGSE